MNIKETTEGREITLELIRIAAPLILCNILQQFYNTADAFVIGRFASMEAFAAVGIASTIMNLFLFGIVGSCTGICVIFSRLQGEGNLRGLRNEYFLTLVPGLVLSLLLGAAGILVLPLIMRVICVPGDLTGLVRLYLMIIFCGLPATWLFNLHSALLRSGGHTFSITLSLAAGVLLNLVLDFALVGFLRTGIAGAACATVVSQLLSGLLAMYFLQRKQPELRLSKEDCYIDRNAVRNTLSLASVTSLHQSGLYIGKMLVQGVVNGGGTAVISAFTAAGRIEGFANSFGDSGSAATSVIVAQYLGAGKKDSMRLTFRQSLLLLLTFGAACSAVMYVTAPFAAALVLGNIGKEALAHSVAYLRLISVFYVFCFTGNTFAGYYEGIGKALIPFIGAASHITMRIILSRLMFGSMGLSAVALATGIGWIWVNLFWTLLLKKRMPAKNTEKEQATVV